MTVELVCAAESSSNSTGKHVVPVADGVCYTHASRSAGKVACLSIPVLSCEFASFA